MYQFQGGTACFPHSIAMNGEQCEFMNLSLPMRRKQEWHTHYRISLEAQALRVFDSRANYLGIDYGIAAS